MQGHTRISALFVGGEDLTDEVRIIVDRPDFTGTYSHVFRGICRGNEVAVKVLKLVSEQLHTMQRKFHREVAVWTHISHRNISPFYGYTDGSDLFGPIGSLISPWYSNGDATKFLRERGQKLSAKDRIELWKGVVSGVCYLHEQDPKIVHGDLKPGNILIDDAGNPRICDFGLACIYLDEGHTDLTTTSPHAGTERYLAPELLEDEAQPSTASDVWALGCIGLQFLYSMQPYQHRQNNRTGLIFQDIRQGVLPASQPARTDARIQSCWPIIVGCWRLLPDLRFNARYVLYSLRYPDATKKIDSLEAVPDNTTTSPQPVPQELPGSALPLFPSASLRKEGTDWFATYNSRSPCGKSLDISILHQFNHESVVCCVRFSKDGRYLATGCNRSAQIFEMKTGALVCKLEDDSIQKAGDSYIRSVCFSPDGKYLATGAEDCQIRIWNIANQRIHSLFEGHEQEVYSLDFSSDGRLVVSGSRDRTVRIWHIENGNSTVLPITNPPSNQCNSAGEDGDRSISMTEAYVSSDAEVMSVAISPDGRLVAAGSLDTVVRLWDVATGTLLERLRGHKDSVWSVGFTPDGRGLVSGSLDKTLKYWELNTAALRALEDGQAIGHGEKYAKCLSDFVGYEDYVLSVAISHDSQWVISGSTDGGVQFWDKNGVEWVRLELRSSVFSIDSSPVGNFLATGSRDQRVRVWKYTPFQSLYD